MAHSRLGHALPGVLGGRAGDRAPSLDVTGGAVTAPRVFVSYTHDSDAHKAAVLEFSELLRSCGIDAELDQWATDQRRDWYRWMMDTATRADFIIVVASAVSRPGVDAGLAVAGNKGGQAAASRFRGGVPPEPVKGAP